MSQELSECPDVLRSMYPGVNIYVEELSEGCVSARHVTGEMSGEDTEQGEFVQAGYRHEKNNPEGKMSRGGTVQAVI